MLGIKQKQYVWNAILHPYRHIVFLFKNHHLTLEYFLHVLY